MHQPGTRSAHLASGGKDEPLAVEAGPFDAEERKTTSVAVSYRDTDSADRPTSKTHRFDQAEVPAGEPVGLLGPHILNAKADVSSHIGDASAPTVNGESTK